METELPWYHEGLSFTCTRCGNCCSGFPGYVWFDEAESQAIADFLGEPLEQFLATYTRMIGPDRSLRETAEFDCIFFDREKGCTIYPVRPQQCRTWPFWESNLKNPEIWEKVKRFCPGSGQGELIPVEEITRRMKIVKM